MAISENIRKHREAKNLSQQKLAELAGVSQPTIYKLEHGKADNVTLQVGKSIAEALGVSFNVLFEIETVQLGAELLEKLVNLEQTKNSKLESRISELEERLSERVDFIKLLQNENFNIKRLLAGRNIEVESKKVLEAENNVATAKTEKEQQEAARWLKFALVLFKSTIDDLNKEKLYSKYDIFCLIYENDVHIDIILESDERSDAELHNYLNKYLEITEEEVQEFKMRFENSYRSP